MKQIASTLSVAFILFMMACNNQPKPAEEQTTVDTTAVAPPPPPAPLTPYKAMLVTMTVKDFDKWYAVYSANDSLRASFDVMSSNAGQGLDNKKWVVVLNASRNLDKLKELEASPARKEAMKKAGVNGAAVVTYYDCSF